MKKYQFSLLVLLLFTLTISCNKGDITPDSNLLQLTTTDAASITANSAISGGNITTDGGLSITERGICFSTTANPTTVDQKVISGIGIGTFSSSLTGLTPNQKYYVRAYGINSSGTTYGNEVTFQTLQSTTGSGTDPVAWLFVSASSSNKLLALDAANGNIKWERTFPHFVYSSPIYYNGMVFVGCQNNRIYAFDTLGVPKWSAPVEEMDDNSPVIANGILYISGFRGVIAFNPENGLELWTFLRNGPSTLLVHRNNTIYYHAYDSLYAIQSATGIKKWSYFTGTFGIPPVVFNDRTYVVCSNSSLAALNTANGSEIWRKQDNFVTSDNLEGINVGNGNVYLLSDGLIILDSASGNFKSSSHLQLSSNSYNSFSDGIRPILTDSFAIVPQVSIYMRDAFTGLEKYIFSGSGYTAGGVTVVGNTMYFPHKETTFIIPGQGVYYAGRVSAFDYKTRSMLWVKQYVNYNFLNTSPCAVTRSGKCYRGGLQYQ